jgi:hypothetical protein
MKWVKMSRKWYEMRAKVEVIQMTNGVARNVTESVLAILGRTMMENRSFYEKTLHN